MVADRPRRPDRVLGVPATRSPKSIETLWALSAPAILVVLPATFVIGLGFPASSSLLADDPARVRPPARSWLQHDGAIVGTLSSPSS